MLKKSVCVLVLLWSLLLQGSVFAQINLTVEEQQWLATHKTLSYGFDPNYPPFEFLDGQNRFVGINAEILKMMSKELGVTIVPVGDPDWSLTLTKLKNRQIDFISASVSEERKKTMLFTEPYLSIPSSIITARDNSSIRSDKDLNGKRVSTAKGWLWNDILAINQPGVNLVVYPTEEAAVAAVAFGEVDATVQDTATASYQIESHKYTNLKRAAPYSQYNLTLHFAVRSDYKELESILEKAFKNIPPEKIEAIQRQWISLNTVPFYKTDVFLKVAAVLSALFAIILAWSFSLHHEVKKRTKALSTVNMELETSMESLKVAQRQLIDQEKMAALGSMVAGISHEVNTPLGVSVTAISLMKKNLDIIAKALEANEMKKSDLKAFIRDADESLLILEQNIDRAVELIHDFKSMAVDQMSEERSNFDMCEYLDRIRTNLKYECKKKGVEVTINCPGNLVVGSYPGVYSHIFTNLMMNSLVHGFDKKTSGAIEITVGVDGSNLVLEYRDNGKGMNVETLQSIYKPFFTTNKKLGNTGLGMHIVLSLVQESLGGTIECHSEMDQGVQFIIRVPEDGWKVSL